MIINPEQVINAILAIANPLIKEKIQRNETVIKLLQQFKLDPEHPPADFSGVYAYALVEYGVGKPKPFLELFRQEAIKQAFRKAFDHNNPSILLSEVDAWLDAYALGDDIRSLGIDIRREIAAFYIVFAEVAKRTRNPADTLMSQQIGSLQLRIANIQELLDRLPTLEGIRTEIARLAAQNSPALLEAETSTENKCRAIALAQQMRGWFETLGYRFEKYEIWGDSYFEWIINVPTRRNRYDRILIRGIEGEVGLKDVAVLRSSVEQQRTDEGWLVTARRIARVARYEVEKEENRHLGCYTFDELIDQDADFSDYLDWLEAEIIRRQIDTKYVPLACTKEEIDPDTKQRIGISHYSDRDGWIDGYIDVWLDDPAKEHISILGEFGTGKTWFAFHYAWVALQRYRDAQKRGVERPRLPLVITLRDFAKAINVENVLAGFFFTQHNIRLTSEVFDQLNGMGKLLLIFDGFDEMAAKVDRQQMINNFWELAKVVVPGAKVILTCRSEHFPDAKEGRALLNAELQASTKQLTGETPQFEVLELEKFNDEQIRLVLSHQTEAATVEQVMGFCPNAQILASGSVDGSVRLWDTKLGECWKIFEDNHSVRSVAFSPDNETLAISNSGGEIKLWNIYTSQCLKTLEIGRGPWTRSIAFSSDGKLLASGTLNESVGLWCPSTGELWKTLKGHTKSVSAVAFSPDGKTLASGADDKTVILWDINSGKCLKILQGHSLWIRSVAFSLDSKMLASCSGDGTIMLWETSTGNCIRTLRPKRPYEEMNITGVTGLTESKKATLKALGAMEDGA